MQRVALFLTLFSLCLLSSSCKSEKKYVRYAKIYSEAPQNIYITPLFDLMTRKSDADSALLTNYICRDSVSRYFVRTLPLGLKRQGYMVSGGDSVLLPSITSVRRLSRLQNDDLTYFSQRNATDAVLVTTLLGWKESRTEPTLFLEYLLRSAKTGETLMHSWVRVSRTVDTTYKGEVIPLLEEVKLADTLHISLDCAMRCLMVERTNLFVTQDLPLPPTHFYYEKDRYLHAMHDYFKITFTNEGTMEVKATSMEEYENECFL